MTLASHAATKRRAVLGQISDADIRLLRVFQAVADCGGMTAAELELNISTSTISRHVKDLETRLGLTLCRRGRGGFALTPEGARIAGLAIPGLEVSAISLPATAYSHITLSGPGWYPLMFQTAEINPYTGDVAVTRLLSDRSGLELVTESMRPLHTGDFGGLWIKLIWFFFGLLLSMMVLSGLLIWTKRTALATANALKRSNKPARAAKVEQPVAATNSHSPEGNL